MVYLIYIYSYSIIIYSFFFRFVDEEMFKGTAFIFFSIILSFLIKLILT